MNLIFVLVLAFTCTYSCSDIVIDSSGSIAWRCFVLLQVVNIVVNTVRTVIDVSSSCSSVW
jgi:hypothetical protein